MTEKKELASWALAFQDEATEGILRDFEEVDVSDEFFNAFMTDSDQEIDRMFDFYKEANAHERAIIDAVFVQLCGFSYATLMKQHLGMPD